MPNLDGQYGIYDVQLARDIARWFRSAQRAGVPVAAGDPPQIIPFRAKEEIEAGRLIQFNGLVEDFSPRQSDNEISRFRNHALHEAIYPESDFNLDHLRRRTWGVSISDVLEDRDGIAIVSGPVCVECVRGDATVDDCGNFIVPWTSKDKAGKGEVRPYGIARCVEQEPEIEGWRWVMMGQCKWDFIGKTTTTHNKTQTQVVNVHFGTNQGSETATGITQRCFNRFADLTTGLWVRGSSEYLGFELTVAECV